MDDTLKPKRAYTRKTVATPAVEAQFAPVDMPKKSALPPRKRAKKVDAPAIEAAPAVPARPAKFGKNTIAIGGARVVMSHSGPNRAARRAAAVQQGTSMARGTNTQVDKVPYRPGEWSYVPLAALRSPGSRYGMTDARAKQARVVENKGTLAGIRKRLAKRSAEG